MTNLQNLDYALPIKESLLRGEQRPVPTLPKKLEAAKAWLGKKYTCHPVNRVKKLAEPLPENFTWAPKRRAK